MAVFYISATTEYNNAVTISIRDYNDPGFFRNVRFTAEILGQVDWKALFEHYQKHSLKLMLKDPVVQEGGG